MPSLPRLALTGTAAGAAAAAATALAIAAAPAAQADSISYVKDGNVHLVTPDGTRDHQVTTAGGYSYASQADDGRIIALHGKRLQLLDRWGQVKADFSPVAAGTAGTITLSGPFDPVISPDGNRVAYGFYVQYTHGDPNCGLPGGCWEGHLYAGTGYSPSTGPANWTDPAFTPNYGWTDPAWIDDARTLLSGPSSAYLSHTGVDTLGDDKHEAAEWFSDFTDGVQNLFDGELNRQGTGAAYVANSQGDSLRIYHVNGALQKGNPPQGCLSAPSRGSAWESPSWSPDGHHLAASDASGLYVVDLDGIDAGCPDASGVKVQTIAPGGRFPDWGPADLPDPSTRPPGTGGGGATTPGGGGAGATAPGAATPGVQAKAPVEARRAALTAAAGKVRARSLTLKVSVPAAGRLSAVAEIKGRRVASAKAKAVRPGTTTITLKARKALPRKARLTVRLTLTTKDGATQRTTLKVVR
jgi:hypothetical protein